MAKKQDIAAMLDALEADAAKKHDRKKTEVFAGTTASEVRTTFLVSMTRSAKERLAADEYITNHKW